MDEETYCTECDRYVESGQMCPCFNKEGAPLKPEGSPDLGASLG